MRLKEKIDDVKAKTSTRGAPMRTHLSLSLSLSLTHTHTHTRARAHTHARTHARTHTHTHTHTLQIHALLVMGWYNEEKKKKREEMGFQLMLDKLTHETLNSERKNYSTAHAYITATIQ